MSDYFKQANVAFLILAALSLEKSLEITWFMTLFPYLLIVIWWLLDYLVRPWFGLSSEDTSDDSMVRGLVDGTFNNARAAKSVLRYYCDSVCSQDYGDSKHCERCEHMRAREFFEAVDSIGAKIRSRKRLEGEGRNA